MKKTWYKINPQMRAEVLRRHNEGETGRKIQRDLGICWNSLNHILHHEKWEAKKAEIREISRIKDTFFLRIKK